MPGKFDGIKYNIGNPDICIDIYLVSEPTYTIFKGTLYIYNT